MYSTIIGLVSTTMSIIPGIPELDVPGLEPLVLPEVDVAKGTGIQAKGTNVTVRGASNFKITRLKYELLNNLPSLTTDSWSC